VSAAAIPAEIRAMPNWVCSRDGKPINPATGRNANCNDPATWGDFHRAWNQRKKFGAVAFAVTEQSGIVGIDLDDCSNPATGELTSEAKAICSALNTYTEASPSGTGLRLFVRGTIQRSRKRKGVEIYNTAKFLTVTGNRLEQYPATVEHRQSELDELFAKYFPADNGHAVNGESVLGDWHADPSYTIDTKKLFRRFPHAQEILETGNGYASQSEADLALANYAVRAGYSAADTADLLVQSRANAGDEPKHRGYYEQTVKAAFGSKLAKVVSDPITSTLADAQAALGGIEFLMPGIPLAMASGVIGAPGDGKSALVMGGMIKPVTTGCDFPNGPNTAGPGHVILVPTEGLGIDAQRAANWGIPAERILLPFADDPLATADITKPDHLERLATIQKQYSVKLIVLDSLRGSHDTDENSSRIAKLVQGLGTLAESSGAAVVIVHHARKTFADEEISANSSRGSNAIFALFRSMLAIDKPDPRSEWRRVRVVKENLGKPPEPFGFRVTATGVEFGPAPGKPHKKTEQDRAMQLLRGLLPPGQWIAAATIIDGADEAGISKTALQRASDEMGVTKKKRGKVWKWILK
jgi:hypothetical protein